MALVYLYLVLLQNLELWQKTQINKELPYLCSLLTLWFNSNYIWDIYNFLTVTFGKDKIFLTNAMYFIWKLIKEHLKVNYSQPHS